MPFRISQTSFGPPFGQLTSNCTLAFSAARSASCNLPVNGGCEPGTLVLLGEAGAQVVVEVAPVARHAPVRRLRRQAVYVETELIEFGIIRERGEHGAAQAEPV